MTDYAEENLSTEQSSPCEDARVQTQNVNQERPAYLEEAASQRPQTVDSITLLKNGRGLPKTARLRNSSEFRLVYNGGERFDGALMTAFVFRHELESHRLGITASRKLSRSAVKRNRAKRLLREAFRSSGAELDELRYRYDLVLNAKRGLLRVKAVEPAKEFRQIVALISRKERETA